MDDLTHLTADMLLESHGFDTMQEDNFRQAFLSPSSRRSPYSPTSSAGSSSRGSDLVLGGMTSLDSLDLGFSTTDSVGDSLNLEEIEDEDVPPPVPPRPSHVSSLSTTPPSSSAPALPPRPPPPRDSLDDGDDDTPKRKGKGKQKSFFRPKAKALPAKTLVFFTPDLFPLENVDNLRDKRMIALVDIDTVEEEDEQDIESKTSVLATFSAISTIVGEHKPQPGTKPFLSLHRVQTLSSSQESLNTPTGQRKLSASSDSATSDRKASEEETQPLAEAIADGIEMDATDADADVSASTTTNDAVVESCPACGSIPCADNCFSSSIKSSSTPTLPPFLAPHPLDEPGLIFVAPSSDRLNDSSVERPVIKAGTPEKLVERLSHEKYPDPEYLACFLMTFKLFMDPKTLLEFLIKRFNLQPPEGATAEEIVLFRGKTLFPIRLRIFNLFKHWTEKHVEDFDQNPEVLKMYKEFVSTTLASSNEMFAKLAAQLMEVINKHEKKKQASQKPAWLRELSSSWTQEYVAPTGLSDRVPVQHITTANTIVSAKMEVPDDDDILDGDLLTSSSVSSNLAGHEISTTTTNTTSPGSGSATTSPSRSPALGPSPEPQPEPDVIPLKAKHDHKKFLLLDTVDLARYFAQVEVKTWLKIERSQFLRNGWQKKDKRKRAPDILESIERFNDMCTWVTSEVLLAPDTKTRAQVIVKMIVLARESLALGNFNTLFQVITGLQYRPCKRLTRTWSEVPSKMSKEFNELGEMMSSLGNFTSYRLKLKMRNPPAVPYLGLLLKDLVFAEDGSPDTTSDGLINFTKMRQIANLILSCYKYLNVPYPQWNIPRGVVVYAENLSLLTDTEMPKLSFQIEPRQQ